MLRGAGNCRARPWSGGRSVPPPAQSRKIAQNTKLDTTNGTIASGTIVRRGDQLIGVATTAASIATANGPETARRKSFIGMPIRVCMNHTSPQSAQGYPAGVRGHKAARTRTLRRVEQPRTPTRRAERRRPRAHQSCPTEGEHGRLHTAVEDIDRDTESESVATMVTARCCSPGR